MEKRFKKLFTALESQFSKKELLEKTDFIKIREIRITVNFPIEIITDEKRFYINDKKISISEITEIFSAFCEYSVHTFKNEIQEGFITAEGGIRIGICGTAVYSEEKLYTIKNISALNIRIPHEIKGVSENIVKFINNGGILIIGPPCSGKTTFLRDLSRNLCKDHLVTIVDERMEISGTTDGIPSFDIGNSYVLNGFIKNDGIKIAVRSMSPDIIICDEFGDENDIRSALFAMKSGTKIVASMHAFGKTDFLSKPFVTELLKKGIFSSFVFLDKQHNIIEILKTEDLNL